MIFIYLVGPVWILFNNKEYVSVLFVRNLHTLSSSHQVSKNPKKRFLINNNKLNYCFSTVNLLVFSLFPCPQNTGKVYLFYAIIIITVLVWLVGWSFSLSISLCTSSQHRSQQPSENQKLLSILYMYTYISSVCQLSLLAINYLFCFHPIIYLFCV